MAEIHPFYYTVYAALISGNCPVNFNLSRVFKAITRKEGKLFYDLVHQCHEEDIILGDTIALDSTAIDAYEKKISKSKLDSVNATWEAKFDSFKNKLCGFGYKIHLAVDTVSELPVALEVTPAHINDGDMGPPLLESLANRLRNEKVPPAGFSFHGNPRCSMGYDMIYWGCDGD